MPLVPSVGTLNRLPGAIAMLGIVPRQLNVCESLYNGTPRKPRKLATPCGHGLYLGTPLSVASTNACETLEVEELLAEAWTGLEVLLPAVLAKVEVPEGMQVGAKMPMQPLQGLGASAKPTTHRLAVG